jgi:hypothetical protein
MADVKAEVNLTVVAGRKRIGKSNETIKQLLFKYVAKLRRRCLIYDHNNEYGEYVLDQYNQDGSINPNAKVVRIDTLPHDKIKMFAGQRLIEIRRIVPIDKFGRKMQADQQEQLIIKMMDEFRNGCIFIEDLNTVFGDTLPVTVSGFITNNAHRNCDVIFHVQDIGRLVPKIWQNTNIVRLHKMLDGVDQSKEKLGKAGYEIFKIAELMVESIYNLGGKANESYFVYVDRDYKKIRGKYATAHYLNAIKQYVDLEGHQMVKRMENQREGTSDKKKYNYQQARQLVITQLFNRYFPD